MKNRIIDLIEENKEKEAVLLYQKAFNVSYDAAVAAVESIKAECCEAVGNHRSDSAFSQEEVDCLETLCYHGQTAEAVVHLAEKYGLSNFEARLTLSELQQGRIFMPMLDAQNTNEIKVLLQNNQKIKAIKRYRELYHVRLRDAKEAVDGIENLLNSVLAH
jgi:ribosomal protein L7/L12